MMDKSNQGNDHIEIINYSPEYRDDIRRLNYEWLEKYFKLEAGDIASLADPQKYILDKGGSIYFVRRKGKIVGTASLLRKTDSVFELGKMAVTESERGSGIGKLLMEHCINSARNMGLEKLILYSNTSLGSAIHLYKKYGFVEVPCESGLYERANIKMEKIL